MCILKSVSVVLVPLHKDTPQYDLIGGAQRMQLLRYTFLLVLVIHQINILLDIVVVLFCRQSKPTQKANQEIVVAGWL